MVIGAKSLPSHEPSMRSESNDTTERRPKGLVERTVPRTHRNQEVHQQTPSTALDDQ